MPSEAPNPKPQLPFQYLPLYQPRLLPQLQAVSTACYREETAYPIDGINIETITHRSAPLAAAC